MFADLLYSLTSETLTGMLKLYKSYNVVLIKEHCTSGSDKWHQWFGFPEKKS